MANYQIVDRPYLFPQRTIFTGDPREIPVIDTGVELPDDGGRVYVSYGEAEEIAQLVGYLSVAEADALRRENADLKAQLAHLPEVIERTIDAIRTAASAAVVDLSTTAPGGDSGDGAVPAGDVEDAPKPSQAARKVAAAASERGRPSL